MLKARDTAPPTHNVHKYNRNIKFAQNTLIGSIGGKESERKTIVRGLDSFNLSIAVLNRC